MRNTTGAPYSTVPPLSPSQQKQIAGTTIVIKYGGAALERQALKEPTIKDIASLQQAGARIVLVHGGSRQLDERMKKINLPIKSINGLRYTCAKTIEEAKVIFDEINAEIVQLLEKAGVRAVGLGAEEIWVIKARVKDREIYGYVGEVESVDVNRLKAIMKQGKIPVIYALGKTTDGQVLNINADDVACAVASALHADKFLLITDVEGVFKNAKDPSSLMQCIDDEEIEKILKEHIVSKGMIPKLEACLEAIKSGVSAVHILSAQQPHALTSEIIGTSNYGTRIQRGKPRIPATR
jgi:acetylglutamate kinase